MPVFDDWRLVIALLGVEDFFGHIFLTLFVHAGQQIMYVQQYVYFAGLSRFCPAVKAKISATCYVTEIHTSISRDDKNIRRRLLILY